MRWQCQEYARVNAMCVPLLFFFLGVLQRIGEARLNVCFGAGYALCAAWLLRTRRPLPLYKVR